MAKLQELLDQQAALAKQISTVRFAERARAISEVQTLITQFGLTAADISVAASPSRKGAAKTTGKRVAVKYRHPDTGATWTGRGRKPKWMSEALAKGMTLGDFAI